MPAFGCMTCLSAVSGPHAVVPLASLSTTYLTKELPVLRAWRAREQAATPVQSLRGRRVDIHPGQIIMTGCFVLRLPSAVETIPCVEPASPE